MSLKKRNKKTTVCIFAHPDDEAFGPSGTIAKFSQDRDVYILCATRGDANGDRKLGQIRSKELELSAKILGVKKVYFLKFTDGTLSNSIYHKLANEISGILEKLRPDTLITFEPLGISGHIDHITVSLVTTYVFGKLKFVKSLLYHCLTKEERKYFGAYFIYFPPGYKKKDINKIVDVSEVWDKKIKAIKAHKSQRQDAQTILKIMKKQPKEEHFLLLEK